jgi:anthranilate synthase component 1
MDSIPKIQLPQKPKIRKITFGLDIYEIFQKLESRFENCFLLESLAEGPDSRYTILGFRPEKIIRGQNHALIINDRKHHAVNPYAALRGMMPQNVIAHNFVGGLVGYLSYEAAGYFEPSLKLHHHADFDRFCFGLYTDGLVFDKTTGETVYFYYRKNRLPQVLALLEKSGGEKKILPQVKLQGFSLQKRQHQNIVSQIQRQIRQGKTFQCQAGIRANYRISGPALPIYAELRKINPSPHMYYIKFGETVVLGASPELLFDLKDGEMQTFPLAGTIQRGKTLAEDRILAKKLLNDPKERAEHLMLVDLHRNDLGKVAKFGTVRVRRLLDVKKFSHVQHLSSEITGLIALQEDMFTALASCFPAGTLSGAPKIESMKIIDYSEKSGRGPYGGAVGFFGFNGSCTFAIPIRSLFLSGNKAFAQASGGIVYDSTPGKEYQEVRNKLRALEVALRKFSV